MSEKLPIIYLARHGETAWSLSGQHTGLTDLPLTERGERNARSLGPRLAGLKFAKVFTSPLQRAARTCELAGFAPVAEVDRDLVEWDYGKYEGRKTADIHAERPGWELFRDGCPDGESLADMCAGRPGGETFARGGTAMCCCFRADIFCASWSRAGSGWRWRAGRFFLLSTTSVSELSYEHNLTEPVIRLWNDTQHVKE